MITVTRIWRWRINRRGQSYIEVTEPGKPCDWVGTDHAYFQLGMVTTKENYVNTR